MFFSAALASRLRIYAATNAIVSKQGAKLLSSRPFFSVDHQNWHCQIGWLFESGHFLFRPWKLSILNRRKWRSFYFNVWNKCENFRWLISEARNFKSFPTLCLLLFAVLKSCNSKHVYALKFMSSHNSSYRSRRSVTILISLVSH